MEFYAKLIVLLGLFLICAISYKKWKSSDSIWPTLRRHGGTHETLSSYRLLAMGMFGITFYNFASMLICWVFYIPNIIPIDLAVDLIVGIILYLIAKSAINKHIDRGYEPDVIQKHIGGVYLSFIGIDFWIKNYAPDLLVKVIKWLV